MDNMDQTSEIKRYYSYWWENPRDSRNAVFERLNQHVWNRIPPGYGKKALDLGSGRGRIISYLLEKGYEVTGVEFNEDFVAHLRDSFPTARIIEADLRQLNLQERFDLVTCIEVTQVLPKEDLIQLVGKLSGITSRIMINISNIRSLHGIWKEIRGFRASFVVHYIPDDLDRALEETGFSIVHRRGIGLVTPITLLKEFRVKLIPMFVADLLNRLDILFPRICHLYYVEGMSTKTALMPEH